MTQSAAIKNREVQIYFSLLAFLRPFTPLDYFYTYLEAYHGRFVNLGTEIIEKWPKGDTSRSIESYSFY